MENESLIYMSLLKVTIFTQVTLLKVMILRTARDFYQQHGIELWN